MARFFHQLASTIAAIEEADRPALAALRPAVEKLLRSVEEAGTDAKSKDLTEAPWPPGCQAEILKTLQEIEDRLSGAEQQATDADTEERLGNAAASLHSLRGEAVRPRPAWEVMGTESRELRGYLRPAADPHSVHGQMMRSSEALFEALGEVAEKVISTLSSLASFQDQSDAPTMVIIPAGRFMMVSHEDDEGRDPAERPQHKVTFANRLLSVVTRCH